MDAEGAEDGVDGLRRTAYGLGKGRLTSHGLRKSGLGLGSVQRDQRQPNDEDDDDKGAI